MFKQELLETSREAEAKSETLELRAEGAEEKLGQLQEDLLGLRKQLQVQLDTHRSSQDDHAAKVEELLAKVGAAQGKLAQQVSGSLGAMQRGLERSTATAAEQHRLQYEEVERYVY